MYVLFDLDDTLVHSGAVREAFAVAAREHGISPDALAATLDALPGRPALEVFEALDLPAAAARQATSRFLFILDELNDNPAAGIGQKPTEQLRKEGTPNLSHIALPTVRRALVSRRLCRAFLIAHSFFSSRRIWVQLGLWTLFSM